MKTRNELVRMSLAGWLADARQESFHLGIDVDKSQFLQELVIGFSRYSVSGLGLTHRESLCETALHKVSLRSRSGTPQDQDVP